MNIWTWTYEKCRSHQESIYRPSADYYTRWKEAKRLVLLSENWRLVTAPNYDKRQVASLHLGSFRCLQHFGGIINFYFMDSATCPSIKRSAPTFPYKAHLAIYWPLLNYWLTLRRVTTEESAKLHHLQQQSPIRYWAYTTAFLYWEKHPCEMSRASASKGGQVVLRWKNGQRWSVL